MPLNGYSPCPGGWDKKVKFCCQDLVHDLERLDRMIEGNQLKAALDATERLEARQPGRACLYALKIQLLASLGRDEEADAASAEFLKRHPENPTALAQAAMTVTEGEVDVREAVDRLQSAIERSGEGGAPHLFESAFGVAELLLASGHAIPAVQHLRMCSAMADEVPQIAEATRRAMVHITVAEHAALSLVRPPQTGPWSNEFDAILESARRGQWRRAAQRLEALAKAHPRVHELQRCLAHLKIWLVEDAAAATLLRRLAGSPISFDEAVACEAMAQHLDPEVDYELVEFVRVEYPVEDTDRLGERLAASDRLMARPAPPRSEEEDEPPPREVHALFDRPLPKGKESPSDELLDNPPIHLATLLVFGRQTDRDARLELLLDRDERFDDAKRLVAEIAGDALGPPRPPEAIGSIHWLRSALRSRELRVQDGRPEHVERGAKRLASRVFLEKWPDQPLGVLGGDTPRQAARDSKKRIPLVAALLNLEFDHAASYRDWNELWRLLGIERPAPFTAADFDVAQVELVWLGRIPFEQLSAEALRKVFITATTCRAVAAARRAGRALMAKGESAPPEREAVWSVLAGAAETSDEALAAIDSARNAAVSAGKSSAHWDIQELQLRLARGEGAEFVRLTNHLQVEHFREPGVAEHVLGLLVELGMLVPNERGELVPVRPAAAAGAPELVLPGGGAAEQPGAIWTPGGDAPAGKKSAIWTPGMD